MLRTANCKQQHVVVAALELRRRRQDHVGVTGRLVQVHVDADHELEVVERVGELLAVRASRAPGLPGQRDERPQLARRRRW